MGKTNAYVFLLCAPKNAFRCLINQCFLGTRSGNSCRIDTTRFGFEARL